jgi:hypothetical protein
LGVKAAGAYSWQPYYFHVPTVLISGILYLLKPSRPLQACNGITLRYWLLTARPFQYVTRHTSGIVFSAPGILGLTRFSYELKLTESIFSNLCKHFVNIQIRCVEIVVEQINALPKCYVSFDFPILVVLTNKRWRQSVYRNFWFLFRKATYVCD